MPIKMIKCCDCWRMDEVEVGSIAHFYGLCRIHADDPEIVEEKKEARRIVREIRKGLPAFYAKLEREAKL